MLEIDANDGFHVLDIYRRKRTILHVKGNISGDSADSSATVVGTSPGDEEICLRLFEELDGPNWLCKISIANSRFWIDENGLETGARKNRGNHWRALLRIQQENGNELLVGEQRTATIN